MSNITIQQNTVKMVSPEGKTKKVSVSQFVEAIRGNTSQPTILPSGIKTVIHRGKAMILVHQSPPEVRSLKWIANDSPSKFGPGTTYRTVRIGLPYVITMALFANTPQNGWELTHGNECFFRNAPLEDHDDELYFPALLNCSKFPEDVQQEKPQAWICTQFLQMEMGRLKQENNINKRIQLSINALARCLFDSGFNQSSESHEGSSWFNESKNVDRRINTVEDWERATEQDPLFVLEVPWLSTKMTLWDMADRIVKLHRLDTGSDDIVNAQQLARLITNKIGE